MSLYNFIGSKIKPYSNLILGGILLIAFIIVGVIVYLRYKRSNTGPASQYKDVANNTQNLSDMIIHFYHVDWCPHCIEAVPKWQAFVKNNDKKVFFDKVQLMCTSRDCTIPMGKNADEYTDSEREIETILSKYKIESFPTIFIMVGNNRYDFDAKVTEENLFKFAESVASQM